MAWKFWVRLKYTLHLNTPCTHIHPLIHTHGQLIVMSGVYGESLYVAGGMYMLVIVCLLLGVYIVIVFMLCRLRLYSVL